MPEMLHGRKASDVFLEFSVSFIKAYIRNNGNIMPKAKKLEEILKIPWTIWNSYSFDGKDNIAYLGSVKLMLKKLPPEPRRHAEEMLENRKTIYSKYKYGLGKYKIKTHPETGHINLKIDSIDPQSRS